MDSRAQTHTDTHTPTIIIIPKCHSYSVMGQIRWFGLYSLLSLCSRLCFLLCFSLVCSISLCHDESGRGSDRHSAVTRLLLSASSLDPLPSLPRSSALLASLPPPLYPQQQLPQTPSKRTPRAGLKAMWGKGKYEGICVPVCILADDLSLCP